MKGSMKLATLVALALGSSQTMAMELGRIQVKSALGQPLLAEIRVTPDKPGDLRNLTARLASDEEFARAGITDGRAKVPLRFSVVDGSGDSKVIRITSSQAINDPFLDLLVQVDNASGKRVREFTILLDPPGMPAPAPAINAPTAATPARAAAGARTSAAAAPSPAPLRSSGSAPAPASSRISKGEYGPVARGETLSAVARATALPDTSINQMMLALKQANPRAFYRDNINALKKGAVLRVPTAEQARAASAAAALESVRRENADWRAGTPAATTTTTVADVAAGPETRSAPQAAAAGNDRLALVSPGPDGSRSTAGGSGAGSSAATGRQELQRSQETVATLQQQGTELKSRVQDLQDINGQNQKLIVLKNSEIADLQRKLAAARQAAGLPPAAAASAGAVAAASSARAAQTAVSAPEKAATAGSAAAAAPAMATASTATAPANAAAVASRAPAAKPVAEKVSARTPTRPSVVQNPWYMQFWVWIAGAVLLVLLLLLALRGRRRRPVPVAGPSLADRFAPQPAAIAASDDGEVDHDANEDGLADDGVVDDGLVDPDQEELLDQLAEHPEDIGLHLELASLYYHRRDVEHFEAAAEAMHAHISSTEQPEWRDVVAMGEDLAPSHPLFGGAMTDEAHEFGEGPVTPVSGELDRELDYRPSAEESAALEAFDLDEYAAASEPSELPPVSVEPPTVSEYHFDFNLTPSVSADSELDAPENTFGSEDDFHFEAASAETNAGTAGSGPDEMEPIDLQDDPVDTKLDLARAYIDMGDAEGARAMLDEVAQEGSQVQRDSAEKLREGIA